VAGAESALIQTEAAAMRAQRLLVALAGVQLSVATIATSSQEPLPEVSSAEAVSPTLDHAALAERRSLVDVAERTAELAATQTRANPELTLSTIRDRGAFAEPYGRKTSLGVRIPLGSQVRSGGRQAAAKADALEARTQLELERQRIASEQESARLLVNAARGQLAAAERRALLARESRGFFEKSFRAGETDLPTRLRIDAEAADADRQAARDRVELGAAISAWRQALGLLPL
jgi:outer membrane protein, heavy metal efflux system